MKLLLLLLCLPFTGCQNMTPEERAAWTAVGLKAADRALDKAFPVTPQK